MGPDGDLCHKLPAPKELFHLNGSILPIPGIELLVPIIRRQQLQRESYQLFISAMGTFNYNNQSLL